MKTKKTKLTTHHIIPRSRGGYDIKENIEKVPSTQHQIYHELFANRIPEEIIDYLVRDFWGGNYDYVKNVYERKSTREINNLEKKIILSRL